MRWSQASPGLQVEEGPTRDMGTIQRRIVVGRPLLASSVPLSFLVDKRYHEAMHRLQFALCVGTGSREPVF